MADLTSWIGGTLGFVASARDDTAAASDYAAKTYAELGVVKDISAVGTTSSAINVSPLKTGFVIPVNGEKTGGDITVNVAYDISDTSYTTLRAKSNTNDTVWFELTDPDGEVVYLQGLVANWQDNARNNTTEKGASFIIRQSVQEVRA